MMRSPHFGLIVPLMCGKETAWKLVDQMARNGTQTKLLEATSHLPITDQLFLLTGDEAVFAQSVIELPEDVPKKYLMDVLCTLLQKQSGIVRINPKLALLKNPNQVEVL